MNTKIDEHELDSFTVVQKTSFKTTRNSKNSKNKPLLQSIEEKFDVNLPKCRDIVLGSAMFCELKQALLMSTAGSNAKITHIRCLALGNFMDDTPATYQFALLLELVDLLDKEVEGGNKEGDGGGGGEKHKINVSVYDPIFTEQEKSYINGIQDNKSVWSIDDGNVWGDVTPASILYFLPHADLELTEYIVGNDSPQFLLSNHIIQHTERFSSAKLFESFPHLSKLVSVVDKKQKKTLDDGFQMNTSKKTNKKRNQRGKKNINNDLLGGETKQKIDYSTLDTNFTNCDIICDFQNGSLLRDQPWQNAFSDLTFHVIT